MKYIPKCFPGCPIQLGLDHEFRRGQCREDDSFLIMTFHRPFPSKRTLGSIHKIISIYFFEFFYQPDMRKFLHKGEFDEHRQPCYQCNDWNKITYLDHWASLNLQSIFEHFHPIAIDSLH